MNWSMPEFTIPTNQLNGNNMQIYLLHQKENSDYDTYDSCVVVAETPEDAVKIHPNGKSESEWASECTATWEYTATWASKPSNVHAKLLGTTNLPAGMIICSSFNAG